MAGRRVDREAGGLHEGREVGRCRSPARCRCAGAPLFRNLILLPSCYCICSVVGSELAPMFFCMALRSHRAQVVKHARRIHTVANDTTYNGWSNRATWNVSLWLNNDEGTYHDLFRMQQRADDKDELAEKIEAYCYEIWPSEHRNAACTPDGDLLRDVDWEEIAESEWSEDDHPPKTFEEAAERYGIKFDVRRVDSRPDKLMSEQPDMRHWRVRLSCGRRSFSLYFSQGSAHTQPPTLTDVLSCIVSDAQSYENCAPRSSSSNFESWCSDLGYDPDSRKAERIYKAVKKQAEQLKRTVGESAYDVLLEVSE